jgi:hypothetical protein
MLAERFAKPAAGPFDVPVDFTAAASAAGDSVAGDLTAAGGLLVDATSSAALVLFCAAALQTSSTFKADCGSSFHTGDRSREFNFSAAAAAAATKAAAAAVTPNQQQQQQ